MTSAGVPVSSTAVALALPAPLEGRDLSGIRTPRCERSPDRSGSTRGAPPTGRLGGDSVPHDRPPDARSGTDRDVARLRSHRARTDEAVPAPTAGGHRS